MLLGLLQRRHVIEGYDNAVDADAGVALRLELTEEVGVLALALPHDGGKHLEARALGQLQHLVDDLLRGLPGDDGTAHGAVRNTDAGEEQPQVVVDLGDGPDRRTRVA